MSSPLAFDHVGVSVASLERSKAFYADALGFARVEHAFTLPQHEIRGVVLLNGAGVRLELFERRGSEPMIRVDHPAEGAQRQGWFQFALGTQELQAAFERAVAHGAKPILAPCTAPDGSTLIAFVADPDGNLVELVQRQTVA